MYGEPWNHLDRAVAQGATAAMVSIGDPAARERLAAPLVDAGLDLATMVHPRSYVAPSARLGGGVFVAAMCGVAAHARLDDHVLVQGNAYVGHDAVLGRAVTLAPGVTIGGRARIGPRAFLGLGAVILPDVSVGEDALVGAGAVVRSDVAAGCHGRGCAGQADRAMTDRFELVEPLMPPVERLVPDIEAALRSRWLTNGPFVRRLEEALGRELDVRHLVAVASGTAGLMVALRALGWQGEVIAASFGFAGTAHAIRWAGCEPVFAEVDRETFALDPASVTRMVTERTAGVLVTDAYGVPADIDSLADSAGVPILADGAHALGARRKGEQTPVRAGLQHASDQDHRGGGRRSGRDRGRRPRRAVASDPQLRVRRRWSERGGGRAQRQAARAVGHPCLSPAGAASQDDPRPGGLGRGVSRGAGGPPRGAVPGHPLGGGAQLSVHAAGDPGGGRRSLPGRGGQAPSWRKGS